MHARSSATWYGLPRSAPTGIHLSTRCTSRPLKFGQKTPTQFSFGYLGFFGEAAFCGNQEGTDEKPQSHRSGFFVMPKTALPSKPTKHNTCEQTHQSFQN